MPGIQPGGWWLLSGKPQLVLGAFWRAPVVYSVCQGLRTYRVAGQKTLPSWRPHCLRDPDAEGVRLKWSTGGTGIDVPADENLGRTNKGA